MRKVLIIASVTVVLGTFAVAVPLLLLKGDDRRLSREDQRICDANDVAYDAVVRQEGDAAVLDGVRTAVQEHSQAQDLSHASPVLRAGALVALDSLALEPMGSSPTDQQLADTEADVRQLHEVCHKGVTATAQTRQPASNTTEGVVEPENPVDVLRRAGASTTAEQGTHEPGGERTALGCFCSPAMLAYLTDPGNLEQPSESGAIEVQVWTYTSNQARDAQYTAIGPSDDARTLIMGDRFTLRMQWVFAGSPPSSRFKPSAVTVADRVGGQVV
jgi:hypothetical protein